MLLTTAAVCARVPVSSRYSSTTHSRCQAAAAGAAARQLPAPAGRRRPCGGSGAAASRRHARLIAARAATAKEIAADKTAAFDAMLADAELPILVDFYTSWCGPCRILAKSIKALEVPMKDQVSFVKVDAEELTEVALRYAVKKLPTMILFKGGQAVDRWEGVLSAQDLQLSLLKHV